ncbi:MAG TPA: DUF3592 domain-containing protein [Tepidisphaeraceae bacterium]|nr:DUF3592 domain-containing protein [Tepidisphaeraceae bacterium]
MLFIDHEPPSRWKLIARGLFVLFTCGLLLFVAFEQFSKTKHESMRLPVPCTITASSVEVLRPDGMAEKPYNFRADFEYDAENVHYKGRDSSQSNDAAEMCALARRYPPGQKTTCWMDPRRRLDAILAEPRRGQGEFWGVVGFAALVSVYGFQELGRSIHPPTWGTWKHKGKGRGIIWLIIGMILLASAAFAWFFGWPMVRAFQAMRWPATECEVLDAGLIKDQIHGQISLTTYKPDVHYRYRINGEEYHSNQYSLTEMASPWLYGKRNTVREFPIGLHRMCFVNPQNPAEAVLSRSLAPTAGFGIWPLVMLIIGILALQERSREARLPPGAASEWKKSRDRRLLRLALMLAAVSFAVMFIFMGEDLVRDLRLNTATAVEMIVVGIAGLIAAVLAFVSGRFGLRRNMLTQKGKELPI